MDTNQKLRILILEDQPEDIALIERELRKSGLEFRLTEVDTKEEYINALDIFHPDIILSDHSLPQFNSLEALQICRKKKQNVPFILVTGTVSEEFAAQSIKSGADDYVLKSNLKRLPTSIKQALYHHEEEKRRLDAEQMIIDQNTQLSKINGELDSFVYNISHNLRAPLLSILGLINLAKIDTNEKKIEILQNYLERIGISANKLDKTLCKILDYSRNARSDFVYEKLDLKELFDQQYLKIMYFEKPDSINYSSHIDCKNEFASDKYRVEVIVNNLISNAIKYQDRSKRVQEILVNGNVNEKSAELAISDNGIGIDSHYFEDIFRMFFRASTLSVGSGLGLYVVRETLLKLEGTISVSSALSTGTTFHVSLPNKINDIEEKA